MPSSGCPQLGLRFLGSEYLVLYMYRMGELWEISSSFMRMSASNRPTPLNIPQLELPVWLPVFAPRLPVSDQSLRDIIDALHWWRTGPSQPTAASIVLNVRIVELVASRVGETTWTTYLESYFKNAWIHSAIMQILYMALREALTRHLAPEVQPRQREIFLDVTEYRDGQQRFNTGKAARHLNTIIQFIPPERLSRKYGGYHPPQTQRIRINAGRARSTTSRDPPRILSQPARVVPDLGQRNPVYLVTAVLPTPLFGCQTK